MKKNLSKFGFVLLATALILPLASCSNDDDDSVKQSSLAINFTLPSDVPADSMENVKLIVSKSSKTDTINVVTVKDTTIILPQGEYKISVTGKVKDKLDAIISGAATVELYANTSTTIALSKIISSPLVIKSIYFSGGTQYYMKDGYIEIANNSDEVQYLDRLILTAPTGNQTTANAWQSNGYSNLYECGQGTVIAFPGTGKDYPIQPGASVVVANDAVDHSTLSGPLCPNLSKADWEIYIDNASGEIDYEAPNMQIIFQNNKYMKAWGLGVMGRGYVLAKLPEGMHPLQYATDGANIMTTPGTTSSMQFLMIPSKYVLDAVDVWNPTSTNHYSTFLSTDDAQGVLNSTIWSGKCIRRKVIRIANGRPYYQDTNKSSDDFLNNQPLTPGVTPTAVDQ